MEVTVWTAPPTATDPTVKDVRRTSTCVKMATARTATATQPDLDLCNAIQKESVSARLELAVISAIDAKPITSTSAIMDVNRAIATRTAPGTTRPRAIPKQAFVLAKRTSRDVTAESVNRASSISTWTTNSVVLLASATDTRRSVKAHLAIRLCQQSPTLTRTKRSGLRLTRETNSLSRNITLRVRASASLVLVMTTFTSTLQIASLAISALHTIDS